MQFMQGPLDFCTSSPTWYDLPSIMQPARVALPLYAFWLNSGGRVVVVVVVLVVMLRTVAIETGHS